MPIEPLGLTQVSLNEACGLPAVSLTCCFGFYYGGMAAIKFLSWLILFYHNLNNVLRIVLKYVVSVEAGTPVKRSLQ